ncbi:MAG: amidohydrolase family protein [Chitinophagaceae bacterium]|nr:amidohydrolase family protein [Chitinophagaceae bacterium]
MKATNAAFILPLNYPAAMDVEDPTEARFVSLGDLKHWELAPTNAASFEKAGITFCLTTADLRAPNQFFTNLRKAFEYGLSEEKAFEALTKSPAQLLGIYDKVGSLETGKIANFLVTSGPVFAEKTSIIENWVQGIKYQVKEDVSAFAGLYDMVVTTPAGKETYKLEVKTGNTATLVGNDTMQVRFTHDGKQVKINYAPQARRRGAGAPGARPGGPGAATALPATAVRLTGLQNGKEFNGSGVDSLGNMLTWTATFVKALDVKEDSARKKTAPEIGKVTYPATPFGWEEDQKPKQETILIKNATVWTNEKEGVLQNADVLIRDGKIAAVGKNLSANGAKTIDGTGKHVTAGIIDEHSHIAAASINEGGQSVTSEVRIADNLNPDDINIYRQLSGGVTSSHILHGSANVIGGQTQLIKLRWGGNDEELKFKNWTGQIKFALGENVKRSSSTQGNTRYPDTRMGVEQVLVDAFTRARDYENEWKAYNSAKDKKGLTPASRPRTGCTG